MTAALASFEKDLRTLIRSRHGIAISLTCEQVKALLKTTNQPSGDAFMQKLRDTGQLRAIPVRVDMHPRYGVDAVVRLIVELNGGAR